MTPEVFFLVFFAVAVVAIGLGVLAWRKEQERIRALQDFCTAHGLSFLPARDRDLAETFRFLPELTAGDNRYAEHVIRGTFNGHEIIAFDHHYENTTTDSKGHRSTTHTYHSVFAVVLPSSFPDLRITPEGLFSKLAQALGYDDIDFESSEFSKAFCVRSPDRKFAYDFCSPRTIEFLLARRSTHLGVHGNLLAQVHGGMQKPELLAARLDDLLAIRNIMPEYLFNA